LAGLSPAKRTLLQSRLKPAVTTPAKNAITPRADRDATPLSFAQERLWFLDQLLPASMRMAYNVPRALRLSGVLDCQALQNAIDALVARHEILRTTYPAVGGKPVPRVAESCSVPLVLLDLRALPGREQESESQRVIAQEIQRPFDLSKDLLLRAFLHRLADQDHVLLLMTHHITSDGWSKGILFRELAALYEAYRSGKPNPLPELPIQYADFAAWQRRGLEGEDQHLDYWKKRLAGAPALLELPTDRARPAIQSYQGATRIFDLPEALLESLWSLSRREGVTLFMTLLTAFKTLLFRYSEQTDLVLGTPISGRNRVETEPLLGDFVNMLILRTDLSGDPSFRELLQRTRQVMLEAHEHGQVPFEKLVAELQPARALSYSPVFQVMFVLENAQGESPQFDGLITKQLRFDTGTAKHDLILSMFEGAQSLRGEFEYATDLFEHETISRLVGHFQRLLEGIVADPNQRLSALPLLTEPERHQSLIAWNDTAVEFPGPSCIHQLFEEQAERRPEAAAVWFEGRRLTYGELNNRANHLANYLQKHGVGPDVLVGICVERSLEMMVGLLGILKAGGAYLPLDLTLPRERLAFMMEDAQVSLLVTQESLCESLPRHEAIAVYLDADWEKIARESPSNPSSPVNGEHLAYVIFTSGSTGQPKGVQLPHRAVVNFLRHMHCRPGMSERDVLFGVAPMSFDASVLDYYVPLTSGACLAVVGREVAGDGRLLAERMAKSAATVMHATPSTWRLLLESGWPGNRQLRIFTGGEALSWELAQQLLQKSAAVWNLYGPTETAVYSAIHQIDPPDGAVLVGRPIANTQIYLLDAHHQPVPVGVPGELCIGGAGVSRGYWRRPGLTAEKYISNRFSAQPGARLYKTGDWARYRPDGRIECLGRLDHQVKVRGHRIELGEIESVLRQHPALAEVVVLAREDVPGDRRLAAYVVVMPGQTVASRDLRGFLMEKLPDYMVPAAFVLLDALPLSPNGKVNRLALPKPDLEPPERVYLSPRTPVEETLAEIWAQALGLAKVGVHDNFFELGGHSLLAAQIVARIREAFQVELPMRCLFELSSLEDLALTIENEMVRDTDPQELATLLAELGEPQRLGTGGNASIRN
jgi:amino acid adenylation domain-containing protein